MNKSYLIVISVFVLGIFSGCITDRTDEMVAVTREFIKDYVKNPETIQFNNETIHTISTGKSWDVYGSGSVEYKGSRKNFSYYISASYEDNKFDCILKELIVGEV